MNPPAWEAWSLSLPGGQLSGKCRGQGPRTLLCLPGYRQGVDAFDAALPSLPGWRCLVVVPPPGHHSHWGPGPWDQATLRALWEALQARYPGATWHLLGFSMGGKLALSLAATAPAAILRQLILIAPDGIRSHPLHRFAVRSRLGQALLRQVWRQPAWVVKPARWGQRLGLLPGFLARFVEREFGSAAHRAYLRETLRLYGPLRVPRQIPAMPTLLIWGARDPLYPARAVARWRRRHPQARLHLLPAGHMVLSSQAAQIQRLLAETLLSEA